MSAPFVKWAGGKGKLVPELLRHVPKSIRTGGTYYEPFAGGAALFFAARPYHGFLTDLNKELMEAFWQVKVNVEAVIQELTCTHYENTAEAFYAMRAEDSSTWHPYQRTARFLYLNRVCFNGLYRVNSKGKFNVPFGKYKNPNIINADVLRAASEALQNSEAQAASFDKVLTGATSNDFVYFDPPYDVTSDTADFTAYTPGGFGWEQQEQLFEQARRLHEMGVSFLLSNAATARIRHLYHDFYMRPVFARRAINSDPEKRGLVEEVLIYNRSIEPYTVGFCAINCQGCAECRAQETAG